MYIEFFFLINDYLKTVTKRIFTFEWLLPFILSVLIFYLLFTGKSTSVTETFKNNSINLLGILVGFSITIITILTTGQSKNLEEIKKIKTETKINGKLISVYRMLLINFTYSVVVEVFLIIIFLIYPLLKHNIPINRLTKYIIFSILVFLIIHILLLTIRNLTDFYLILTKPKEKRKI